MCIADYFWFLTLESMFKNLVYDVDEHKRHTFSWNIFRARLPNCAIDVARVCIWSVHEAQLFHPARNRLKQNSLQIKNKQ